MSSDLGTLPRWGRRAHPAELCQSPKNANGEGRLCLFSRRETWGKVRFWPLLPREGVG